MAYNLNYTTLPTFTSNSIGYLVASQNYTTSYSYPSSATSVFSVSAIPGIYLFTCCVGFSLPGGLNDSQPLSFNLTNSTDAKTICYYNNATYNGLNTSELLCGTLSHVFPITTTSTLVFTITDPPSTVNPDGISYSLVRIA